MDYMTVIWIVVVGAILLSALIAWSVGETRRHQHRSVRSRGTRRSPVKQEKSPPGAAKDNE